MYQNGDISSSAIHLTIKQWLTQHFPGLKVEASPDDVGRLACDAILISQLLLKYGIVPESLINELKKTQDPEENYDNFKIIRKYLEDVWESYDEDIIRRVSEGNEGSGLRVLMELYINLKDKGLVHLAVRKTNKRTNSEGCELKISTSDTEWRQSPFQKKLATKYTLTSPPASENYPRKFNQLLLKEAGELINNINTFQSKHLLRPSNTSGAKADGKIQSRKHLKKTCVVTVTERPRDSMRLAVLQRKALALERSAYRRHIIPSNQEYIYACVKKGSDAEIPLKMAMTNAQLHRKCALLERCHRKKMERRETVPVTTVPDDYDVYADKVKRMRRKMEAEEREMKALILGNLIRTICSRILSNMVDVAMRVADYRSKYFEVTKRSWKRWMTLLRCDLPIFPTHEDPLRSLMSADGEQNESLRLVERRRQDAYDSVDLSEYLEFDGTWSINEDDSYYQILEMPTDLKTLSNLVSRLLRLKYPPPEPLQPPAGLEQFPVSAIIVGLEESSSLKTVYEELVTKDVLMVMPSVVVAYSLKCYEETIRKRSKQEESILMDDTNEEESKVDHTYDNVLETHSEIFSPKYSQEERRSEQEESILMNYTNGGESTVNNKCDHGFEKLSVIFPPKYSQEERLTVTGPRFPMEICYGCHPELRPTNQRAGDSIDENLTNKLLYGKLAYEKLCLGGRIDDSVTVGMIVEYVKEFKKKNGWVLINFPETVEQAIVLEEALTGKKVPERLLGQLEETRRYFTLNSPIPLEKTAGVNGVFESSSLIGVSTSESNEDKLKSILFKDTNSNKTDEWTTYFTKYIRVDEWQPRLWNNEVRHSECYSLFRPTKDYDPLVNIYKSQEIYRLLYYLNLDKETLQIILTHALENEIYLSPIYIKRDSTLEQNKRASELQDTNTENINSEAERSSLLSKGKVDEEGQGQSVDNAEENEIMPTTDATLEIPINLSNNFRQKHLIKINLRNLLKLYDNHIPSLSTLEHEDMSPLELEITEPISSLLPNYWETLEQEYLEKIKLMFFGKRLHEKIYPSFMKSVQKRIEVFFARPSKLQIIVNKLQSTVCNFKEDDIKDPEVKSYLFSKWFETKEELHSAANERHLENEDFCYRLLKDLPEMLCRLATIFVTGMQTEVNRCTGTIRMVNYYYSALLKKPSPKLRFPPSKMQPITTERNIDQEQEPEMKTLYEVINRYEMMEKPRATKTPTSKKELKKQRRDSIKDAEPQIEEIEIPTPEVSNRNLEVANLNEIKEKELIDYFLGVDDPKGLLLQVYIQDTLFAPWKSRKGDITHPVHALASKRCRLAVRSLQKVYSLEEALLKKFEAKMEAKDRFRSERSEKRRRKEEEGEKISLPSEDELSLSSESPLSESETEAESGEPTTFEEGDTGESPDPKKKKKNKIPKQAKKTKAKKTKKSKGDGKKAVALDLPAERERIKREWEDREEVRMAEGPWRRVMAEWRLAVEEELKRATYRVVALRGVASEEVATAHETVCAEMAKRSEESERRLSSERRCITQAMKRLLRVIVSTKRNCPYVKLDWNQCSVDDRRMLLSSTTDDQKESQPVKMLFLCTRFCSCQVENLRKSCTFLGPSGFVESNKFTSFLWDSRIMLKCHQERHSIPKLWKKLTWDELQEIICDCFGRSGWVNWRNFIVQALELPFPTQRQLIDAMNQCKYYDTSNKGTISYKDYSKISFWYECIPEIVERKAVVRHMRIMKSMQELDINPDKLDELKLNRLSRLQRLAKIKYPIPDKGESSEHPQQASAFWLPVTTKNHPMEKKIGVLVMKTISEEMSLSQMEKYGNRKTSAARPSVASRAPSRQSFTLRGQSGSVSKSDIARTAEEEGVEQLMGVGKKETASLPLSLPYKILLTHARGGRRKVKEIIKRWVFEKNRKRCATWVLNNILKEVILSEKNDMYEWAIMNFGVFLGNSFFKLNKKIFEFPADKACEILMRRPPRYKLLIRQHKDIPIIRSFDWSKEWYPALVQNMPIKPTLRSMKTHYSYSDERKGSESAILSEDIEKYQHLTEPWWKEKVVIDTMNTSNTKPPEVFIDNDKLEKIFEWEKYRKSQYIYDEQAEEYITESERAGGVDSKMFPETSYALLRIQLAKLLLYKTFSAENGELSYFDMLFAFCKDRNPLEGLRKALALHTGKIIIDKACRSNDNMTEQRAPSSKRARSFAEINGGDKSNYQQTNYVMPSRKTYPDIKNPNTTRHVMRSIRESALTATGIDEDDGSHRPFPEHTQEISTKEDAISAVHHFDFNDSKETHKRQEERENSTRKSRTSEHKISAYTPVEDNSASEEKGKCRRYEKFRENLKTEGKMLLSRSTIILERKPETTKLQSLEKVQEGKHVAKKRIVNCPYAKRIRKSYSTGTLFLPENSRTTSPKKYLSSNRSQVVEGPKTISNLKGFSESEIPSRGSKNRKSTGSLDICSFCDFGHTRDVKKSSEVDSPYECYQETSSNTECTTLERKPATTTLMPKLRDELTSSDLNQHTTLEMKNKCYKQETQTQLRPPLPRTSAKTCVHREKHREVQYLPPRLELGEISTTPCQRCTRPRKDSDDTGTWVPLKRKRGQHSMELHVSQIPLESDSSTSIGDPELEEEKPKYPSQHIVLERKSSLSSIGGMESSMPLSKRRKETPLVRKPGELSMNVITPEKHPAATTGGFTRFQKNESIKRVFNLRSSVIMFVRKPLDGGLIPKYARRFSNDDVNQAADIKQITTSDDRNKIRRQEIPLDRKRSMQHIHDSNEIRFIPDDRKEIPLERKPSLMTIDAEMGPSDRSETYGTRVITANRAKLSNTASKYIQGRTVDGAIRRHMSDCVKKDTAVNSPMGINRTTIRQQPTENLAIPTITSTSPGSEERPMPGRTSYTASTSPTFELRTPPSPWRVFFPENRSTQEESDPFLEELPPQKVKVKLVLRNCLPEDSYPKTLLRVKLYREPGTTRPEHIIIKNQNDTHVLWYGTLKLCDSCSVQEETQFPMKIYVPKAYERKTEGSQGKFAEDHSGDTWGRGCEDTEDAQSPPTSEPQTNGIEIIPRQEPVDTSSMKVLALVEKLSGKERRKPCATCSIGKMSEIPRGRVLQVIKNTISFMYPKSELNESSQSKIGAYNRKIDEILGDPPQHREYLREKIDFQGLGAYKILKTFHEQRAFEYFRLGHRVSKVAIVRARVEKAYSEAPSKVVIPSPSIPNIFGE